MSPIELVLLYLAFRAKQVICDFFLRTGRMVSAQSLPLMSGGLAPLAMHAGIHAAFTFILVFLFAPALWWLGAVDFFLHAAIDRAKTEVVTRNGWTYADSRYWWAFGLDQEAHNLTHLLFIILIVWHSGGIV